MNIINFFSNLGQGFSKVNKEAMETKILTKIPLNSREKFQKTAHIAGYNGGIAYSIPAKGGYYIIGLVANDIGRYEVRRDFLSNAHARTFNLATETFPEEKFDTAFAKFELIRKGNRQKLDELKETKVSAGYIV